METVSSSSSLSPVCSQRAVAALEGGEPFRATVPLPYQVAWGTCWGWGQVPMDCTPDFSQLPSTTVLGIPELVVTSEHFSWGVFFQVALYTSYIWATITWNQKCLHHLEQPCTALLHLLQLGPQRSEHTREPCLFERTCHWDTQRYCDRNHPLLYPRALNNSNNGDTNFKFRELLCSNPHSIHSSLTSGLLSVIPKERFTKRHVKNHHPCKHKKLGTTLH